MSPSTTLGSSQPARSASFMRGAWRVFELSLGDGRTLTYCLYGPDEGSPVLFHYGTPGVRLLAPQAVRAAVRRGVRLLVLDRPGYGGSSRPRPTGGHLLTDEDLDSLYAWLTAAE